MKEPNTTLQKQWRLTTHYIEKFDKLHPEHSIEDIDYADGLFAPVEQLQSVIQDKDRIIEDLKNESVKLKKQVSIAEKNQLNGKSGKVWLNNCMLYRRYFKK